MEVLKRTLETFPVPAELSWSWREDGRVEVLEPSWADIVCCSEVSEARVSNQRRRGRGLGDRTDREDRGLGDRTDREDRGLGDRTDREDRWLGDRTDGEDRGLGDRTDREDRGLGDRTDREDRGLGDRTDREDRGLGDRTARENRGLGDRTARENRGLRDRTDKEDRGLGDRTDGEDRGLGDRTDREDRGLGDRTDREDRGLGDRTDREDRGLGDRTDREDRGLGDRTDGEDRGLGDRTDGEDRGLGDRTDREDRGLGDRTDGEDRGLGDRTEREDRGLGTGKRERTSMSKIQRHQQEAMWEFIHTEIIYINKLTIVTDVRCHCHHTKKNVLSKVSSAQLFSNLPSILDAHRLFWQEVIYPILQGTRLTGQPFDPLKLEPGCLQFPERFSVYLDYCWEEEKNVEFTRNQLETNPHFHIFVLWVETHPQCRRMRLGDMQAKPHQRITKYPLLLKAILKTTQDPPTQHALQRMLSSVTQFLDSINDYLQFKDDEMDLFDLSQRIEGYELQGMGDEIDKHIQEFCHFDLTSPVRGSGPKAIRKLLLEEPLKVRGRKDSKLEVNVLLFTDVLLLTKAQKKTDKQKVVHPPLELERIHCAELKDGSFIDPEKGGIQHSYL
uniref:DH domain-containing protein n=1 Tax=Electrophorus electricus TaxID=8005 RepID=A0A4W4H0S4_ELEEL